jgi:hypothetical protein
MLRYAALVLLGCGSTDAVVNETQDSEAQDAESDTELDAARPDVVVDTSDAATPSAKVRYPYGALHSPFTPEVAARMRAIVATSPHRKDVFAKVGDSNTVNTNFLHCFNGSDVRLDTHGDLEPTRAFFRKTLADGARTSFDRVTLAATVGWGTAKPIAGDPTPIEQEVAAIKPAFAVVMLGTNDTYEAGVSPFEKNLGLVVDALVKEQVAPILTTIPQRSDTAVAAALVDEMNAVIRAIAEHRAVPLIDLAAALEPLPEYGLASDGIHLQVYSMGGAHGCWLTPAALTEGMNQRNLLTLQGLDRLRRFVLESAMPEARPPAVAGTGGWMTPFAIDAVPFTDHHTTAGGADEVDKYPCGSQDESGPEVVYRIDLDKPAKLRIRVFADEGADVDLHWLDGATAATCTARGDRLLDVDAMAGSHRVVVDTFATGGIAKSGGYRLTILPRP